MRKGFPRSRAALLASVMALLFFSSITLADQPEPMLFYQATHDLLRTSDHFSVSVYDDGVALVHYPEYMEKAGDYSVQLTAAEVQELRLLLEHPLVQGFNPAALKAQKRDIDAQSDELFAISDDTWSHFEINIPGAQKQIRWANLFIDADRYPGLGIFRKLAGIETDLRELDQHPSARPVSD